MNGVHLDFLSFLERGFEVSSAGNDNILEGNQPCFSFFYAFGAALHHLWEGTKD